MAKYLKQRAPKLLPFRTPLDLTQRKQIYLYATSPQILSPEQAAVSTSTIALNQSLNDPLFYSPDFTVTLIRTPFLPPNYASFWVPLNFNKLDIKDYLKRAYNVDVLKVRSYVEQQNVTREMPRGRQGYGALRRPMSKKRMTVEMTEPFVWPEPPTDHEAYVYGYYAPFSYTMV